MLVKDSEKHIKIWNYEVNGDIPKTLGSTNKTQTYSWKCECGSVWEGIAYNITQRKHNICQICVHKKTSKDLTGVIFGDWTVLRKSEISSVNGYKWICQCKCGTEKELKTKDINKKTSLKCFQCHIKTNNQHPVICGEFWRNIRMDAASRNLFFNITKEEIYNQFLKQGERCALTGESLVILKTNNDYLQNYAKTKNHASLDRIDSKRGYEVDNIQWVLKDINWMKFDFDQNEFIELCGKVSKYNQP